MQVHEKAFIYNVTMKVDRHIAESWLTWLQQEHIPEIMNTGCFTDFVILRLIEVDESEGPTYAVQYHVASKADYNRYIAQYAPDMRKRSYDKWGDSFIAFRTVMQVVK
jgi:hypothetical protein